jgi:hypothetical protein
MADIFKVLGQLKPAATTLTDLYTVPAVTSATLSTLVVCNQSSIPTTFRMSAAIAGAADALSQYEFYDMPIQGNDTIPITMGITLAATDKIRVYSASGNVSFNAHGVEVS